MAAHQGHPGGQRGLGFMLLNGGPAEDVAQAVELLSLAAEQGDGYAAYNLGVLFSTGGPAVRDEGRAETMFRRAAELGLAAGAAAVAAGYAAHGELEMAREWNRRAAESGSIVASFELARACRDGKGGPVDLIEAMRWFLAPLNRGDASGVEEAVAVATRLSADEIALAARLAQREIDTPTLLRRAGKATG